MVRMVLLEVRMVLLEVTWTVEELLERRTLEDLLENLLFVEVGDDEDDGDDDVEEKEEGHLGRLVGELALGGGGGGAV